MISQFFYTSTDQLLSAVIVSLIIAIIMLAIGIQAVWAYADYKDYSKSYVPSIVLNLPWFIFNFIFGIIPYVGLLIALPINILIGAFLVKLKIIYEKKDFKENLHFIAYAYMFPFIIGFIISLIASWFIAEWYSF